MSAVSFNGVGVALVTPFTENLELDLPALGRIIDYNINNGVDYFIVLGTTGESVTLTPEEKNTILRFVVKHTAGRVPLVAGWGGNNTADVLDQLKHYDFTGYNALLSVAPYYNKPAQAGLLAHFTALANAAPLPIILYNVPGRSAVNISTDVILELAKHKNVIGVKEASGNLTQWSQLCRQRHAGFYVISGDDNLTIPGMSFGMEGVISVVAQGFPETFSKMVDAALANDFKTAGKLHLALYNAMELLFAEGSPAGIKAALHARGLCHNTVRLPLVTASPALYDKIKTETALLS